MLCKQPSLPECPEGMFVVRKEKREMSKKMFKFQDNKFNRANRAAKKFLGGGGGG